MSSSRWVRPSSRWDTVLTSGRLFRRGSWNNIKMDRSTRYTDKFFRGYVCVVQVQSVPTGLDCHLPTRCGSRQSSDQVIERECIHCYPQRELKVLMYVLLLSFSRPYLIADVYPFSPLNGCEAAGGDMPHPVRPAWRTAALNTSTTCISDWYASVQSS